MPAADLKKIIETLENDLISIAYHKIDIKEKPKDIAYDFKTKKTDGLKLSIYRNIDFIERKILDLISNSKDTSKIIKLLSLSSELKNNLNKHNIKGILLVLDHLKKEIKNLDIKTIEKLDFKMPKLHPDIKEEIIADLNELKKCYDNQCCRSVVIICGRIMETVLHRKYYEVTGNDILEKNPGIGLGNMIAKLKDKNIKFDPGLTQQIHLINQLRIFSVHKKQDVFYPTREQAHAMILYTLDAIRKLF